MAIIQTEWRVRWFQPISLSLVFVAAPCGPPPPNGYAPQSWQEVCPYTVLDFNDLVPGTYVHDELMATKGVKITAKRRNNKAGYTPVNGVHQNAGGGAMVFDTLHPTGNDGQSLCGGTDGDDDLGAPNAACDVEGPKPGHGPGGAPFRSDGSPNPYQNCKPIGNVLIIQESNKPCPDDSWRGGWIIFDFVEPAHVALAKLLDVDEGNTPEITVTYADGSPPVTHIVPATGDNGLVETVLNADNVSRVSIFYYGSGSISELVYRVCPETLA